MLNKTFTRLALATAVVVSTIMLPPAPANAASGASQGHGIKCVWVLVSTANGTNTYQQYCYRGV
jgi:hypothetical protein